MSTTQLRVCNGVPNYVYTQSHKPTHPRPTSTRAAVAHMETALTAWADATAPVDVSNVQKNRLFYTSVCENVALARTSRQNSGIKDEDDERYHCRPWDHAHFLARVRSFCTSWWFAKPREISALECARHGWSNSGPDELQCSW